MMAQRLSLISIGRVRPGRQQPRHGIKAVDRLLGNAKMQRERLEWWTALAHRLIEAEQWVVVLLDWTQIGGDMWALVAAVPFHGRSLPVFCENHDESKVGCRDVHVDFLRRLRSILPAGCIPVIVADGGFRSPFFVACSRNEEVTTAQCLGDGRPYATSRESRLIRIVLGPATGKRGKRRREDYQRKRAKESWLLATNLQNDAAETVTLIGAAAVDQGRERSLRASSLRQRVLSVFSASEACSSKVANWAKFGCKVLASSSNRCAP